MGQRNERNEWSKKVENEKSVASIRRTGSLEFQLLQLGIARLQGNWCRDGYCLYCRRVHLPLR
jgi:hypothetical protein